MSLIKAEYIWVDGTDPTPMIRGKTRLLDSGSLSGYESGLLKVEQIPIWGFDGSSTQQAEGNDSDRVLRPVAVYRDPFRNGENENTHVLVLNEVHFPPRTGDTEEYGKVHESNTRARLREVAGMYEALKFQFGVEQEYTFMNLATGNPLGFPAGTSQPAPQGPYYCSVGGGNVDGRAIMERHLDICAATGIPISGTNAEVMLGQWEYQMGHETDPLTAADNLTMARYLMLRVAEEQGVGVSLEPKPMKGDWNGTGAHTNFSTEVMRKGGERFGGLVAAITSGLDISHKKHIDGYGAGNEERLTGKHETCDIDTFRAGVSDRGASIRIPWQVHVDGKGYLEDRRPSGNMDPYTVFSLLMETVGSAQKAFVSPNGQVPRLETAPPAL